MTEMGVAATANEINRAAITTVTTIGAAKGDVLLTPKCNTSSAAVTRLDPNLYQVAEHDRFSGGLAYALKMLCE
ncbi:uncharacterized protein METZ01_LOCUS71754 [marine metagenome]|uniref:Uncharacterized protein n=1 Tax=marine metagenome TaxID=408172 RepID=A0A381TS98_9ZZZZ